MNYGEKYRFEIDRDLNVAVNILNEGSKAVNTAGTAEINSCGDMNLEVGDLAQEAVGSLDQQ